MTDWLPGIQRDSVPVVLSTDSLFTKGLSSEPRPSALHPDGDRFILSRNADTVNADEGAAEPPRLILVQNFFEELRQVLPDN